MQKNHNQPLGHVDGRPVYVGAELEQLTRKGWVRHNAQESWRGLNIDWKHDFRWPAINEAVARVTDAEEGFAGIDLLGNVKVGDLLYATPAAALQPVAENSGLSSCACCGAPEGEWVVRPKDVLQPVAGLTDADIDELQSGCGDGYGNLDAEKYARAIERHIKGQTK